MTTSISAERAKVMLDAGNALVNAGTIEVYQGTRPATVDTAITSQVLLGVFTIGATAFAAATQITGYSTATANTIAPVDADVTGTAQFYRAKKSNGSPWEDGKITDTAGDGDMKMANVAVVEDVEMKIVSWTEYMPYAADLPAP